MMSMVRILIVAIVVAVAFTLYALVDAAMTDASRARGVNKPVWIVFIVVFPVIGALLWVTVGKGAPRPDPPVPADDDPRFSGTRISDEELDARMMDLEAQLRALDDEVYPGEEGSTAAPEAEGEDTDPSENGTSRS